MLPRWLLLVSGCVLAAVDSPNGRDGRQPFPTRESTGQEPARFVFNLEVTGARAYLIAGGEVLVHNISRGRTSDREMRFRQIERRHWKTEFLELLRLDPEPVKEAILLMAPGKPQKAMELVYVKGDSIYEAMLSLYNGNVSSAAMDTLLQRGYQAVVRKLKGERP